MLAHACSDNRIALSDLIQRFDGLLLCDLAGFIIRKWMIRFPLINFFKPIHEDWLFKWPCLCQVI